MLTVLPKLGMLTMVLCSFEVPLEIQNFWNWSLEISTFLRFRILSYIFKDYLTCLAILCSLLSSHLLHTQPVPIRNDDDKSFPLLTPLHHSTISPKLNVFLLIGLGMIASLFQYTYTSIFLSTKDAFTGLFLHPSLYYSVKSKCFSPPSPLCLCTKMPKIIRSGKCKTQPQCNTITALFKS